MTVSRRTTLAMLGLAPATGIAAESFLEGVPAGEVQTGSSTSSTIIANALERLAAQVRAGKVLVEGLKVDCAVEPNTIVVHALSVRFIYPPEV